MKALQFILINLFLSIGLATISDAAGDEVKLMAPRAIRAILVCPLFAFDHSL